ncbi:MAG: hypothetical protein ACRC1P_08875 [Cellulosilyticaceae bacterium]
MKLLKTIPGLEKFCNAIWGGGTTEVVHVQDVGTKLFGKIYIDKISKKAYRCIANPSTTSTDLTASNFEACNVVDNLDKLQNLPKIKALTVDIDSGPLSPTNRRERKAFDISALNINPIYVFPYVPVTSAVSGVSYLECVSLASFNNNNIIVDFDYGGSTTIVTEAKATILYYE